MCVSAVNALYWRTVRRDSAQDDQDSRAISACLAGDREAFRTIVESYEPVIRHLAERLLGDPVVAEDAVQDVFLKTYRSLDRFDRRRRFFPWLYGIAVNQIRTSGRRSHRRNMHEQPMELPVSDTRHQPEADALRAATEQAVRDAVSGLPAGIRKAVVLYYYEGLSVDEVAEALGLGRENIKSKLHRGRKKLRTILEPDATDREGR